MIRVEQAGWPCSLRGHSFEEVRTRIEAAQNGDATSEAFLKALCDAWNGERDQRPADVTTAIQVEACLAEGRDDWAMRLHPRIDYRPEHFYRAGVIAEPVTMPLAWARGFHLPWVRLYAERDDFGAALFAAGIT